VGFHELLEPFGVGRDSFLFFQVPVVERHREVPQVNQGYFGAGLSRSLHGDLDQLFVEGIGAGAAGEGQDAGGGHSGSSCFVGVEGGEDAGEVVGVLLLHRQDPFEHAAGGGVFLAEVADHLGVGVNGDPLRDQVLFDHVEEGVPLHVLGVAAGGEPFRAEVGFPAQLDDAGGDLIGVDLLLGGVLEELLGDRVGVDPFGHVEVPLVAQDADDLGGKRLVEQLDDGGSVGLVPFGDGPFLDVLAGPPAQLFDVGQEVFHGFIITGGAK